MQKNDNALKPRDLYLTRLAAFQDTDPIKIVTGIRRCGKSSLLALMRRRLLAGGVAAERIIDMNFESMAYRDMDSRGLYQHVRERIAPGRRAYLFLDEPQRVEQWEDAVNSFRVDFDCDIYITGSNACLLSSEYATYLAGRSVEIHMLPLSFREFLDFHGYTPREYAAPGGEPRKRAIAPDGAPVELMDLFEAYLRYGGMPGIADVGLDQDKVQALLEGIYAGVVVRDILERGRRRGQRHLTDAELLRKIVLFLADNIGNTTSLNGMGNTLVNERMLEHRSKQGRPAVQTLAAYVNALKEAYMFYEIKRFDVKGKAWLRTLGKYSIVDPGLRNSLLGYRDLDSGRLLENIVHLELLRRGYDVGVGKVGDREVDFIAVKDREKIYYQVTEEMYAPATRERELAPLLMIRDNYEKTVLALHADFSASIEGIRVIRLLDFLLA